MMDLETKLCNNCKRGISVNNFATHSAFCERKLRVCNLCDEPVPRSEMDRHLEESHTMDSCSCCSMPMEKWMLEKHKEICSKRPVSCKYCEIDVPMDDLEDHHLYCGSRTEMCSSCKQYIMLTQMDTHSKICLEKILIARNSISSLNDDSELNNYTSSASGNSIEDAAYKRESSDTVHSVRSFSLDTSDTDLPSKFSSKDVHYKTLASCEYCQLQLPVVELQNHYLYCGLQKEKCSICNQYVSLREMDRHSKICIKHYLRTDRSMYDNSLNSEQFSGVTENMAKVFKSRKVVQDQCIEKFVRCEYCKTEVTLTELEDHLLWCTSKTEKCAICEQDIFVKEMNTHLQKCRKASSKYIGECCICKQLIPWVDMNVHIACCASANDKCSRCGSDVPRNKLKEHVLRLCPELQKESVLNCEDSISENEENKASRSFESPKLIKCSKREEGIESCVTTDHVTLRSSIFYECPLCAELVHTYERSDHEAFLCKVRNSEGEPGMSFEEMSEASCAIEEFKKRNTSSEVKTEKCPYCNNNIPVLRYSNHLSYCSQRVKECELCGLIIKEATMELHLEKCTLKDKFSSHHKGSSSINSEEKLKLFNNEEFKAGKAHLETDIEKCPCCNHSITRIRFEDHLKHCLNETKECKFCGLHFNVGYEKMHLQECSKVKSDSTSFKSRKNKKHQKKAKKNSSPVSFIEPNPSTHVFKTFKEEVQIPCEFCQELFSPDRIIEHESGCRPDLVSFPKKDVEAQGAIRKIHARNCYKRPTFDIKEDASLDRIKKFEEHGHKSADAHGERKQELTFIDRQSTPLSTVAPGEFLDGYSLFKKEHEVASSGNSTCNPKMTASARKTVRDNLKLCKENKVCDEKIFCSGNTSMVSKAETDVKNQSIKYLDVKSEKNSCMISAQESNNCSDEIKNKGTHSCIEEKNFTDSSESTRLKPCVEVLSGTDKEKIEHLKDLKLDVFLSSSSEDEDLEECIKFLKNTEMPSIEKKSNICLKNEVYNGDASTMKKFNCSDLSAVKMNEDHSSEITHVHSFEKISSKGAHSNENENSSENLSEFEKYLISKGISMEMTAKYNSFSRPSSNDDWNKWRSKASDSE